jgi:hypothetical protein
MILPLANPSPPFLPLSHQQVFFLSHSYCVSPVDLTERSGGGRGAKSYNREKAGPSINHSICSAVAVSDQASQVREALEIINTAQLAATTESREGAKKLALQQQVTIIPLHIDNLFYIYNFCFILTSHLVRLLRC